MTTPLPDPWEPLTTMQELAKWVQLPEIPEDRVPLAEVILAGAAIVIREAGSKYWTHDTVPPRVKIIADLKAKNFFEHPTGAVSETTGPLSERFLDDVVRQLELSDAERQLIASYAQDGTGLDEVNKVTGLWTLSTTRGPLETHQNAGGVLTVPWYRQGSKPFPWYVSGAFGSPDEA